MSLSPQRAAELHELLWQLRAGDAAPQQLARLERLVCEDPQVRAFYVRYMHLCADLHWNGVEKSGTTNAECGMMNVELPGKTAPDGIHHSSFIIHHSETPGAEALIPPIIIDTSLADRYPPSAGLFAVGSPLFSYAAATVITGVIILISWMWKVSLREEVAESANSRGLTAPGVRAPTPEMEPVGRITGMVDCRWANPQDAPSAAVPLGRKYELAAGLMEITYQTGARVILEGPCAYEVDSPRGGFLSLGKLTARVEKSPFPLPPSAFVIRTPTAVVTDIGTEFGVEVDKFGATRSHVFRGKIEVRMVGDDGRVGDAIQLAAGQSARVARTAKGAAVVGRGTVPAGTFARQLPSRAPIKLFNTGVGVKEGEPDPHWQLFARSDEPQFKPRPALVTSVDPRYLANDSTQSQWISAVDDLSPLPDDVTYTFRTTFELAGMTPNTAILRGSFLVDDYVTAVRLNGRSLNLCKHPRGSQFIPWDTFEAVSGFVDGRNVLEVDVLNQVARDSKYRGMATPMALRVEMEGSYINRSATDGGVTADPARQRAPSKPQEVNP